MYVRHCHHFHLVMDKALLWFRNYSVYGCMIAVPVPPRSLLAAVDRRIKYSRFPRKGTHSILPILYSVDAVRNKTRARICTRSRGDCCSTFVRTLTVLSQLRLGYARGKLRYNCTQHFLADLSL